MSLDPSSAASERPHEGPFSAARAWHGGWGLGFGVLAALLLLLARTPPAGGVLGGLGLLAVPAAVGALALVDGTALLAVWVVCTALGVGLAGGLAGPLAPALAGPVLAALALRGARRQATGAAGAVLVAAVAAELLIRPQAGGLSLGPQIGMRVGALAVVLLSAAFAWTGLIPPTPAAAIQPGFEPAEHLRAALAEAQAGRAAAEAQAEGRSRFIAQMSHELRTPLNAIQGFSDIMRTRLFGPIPDRYGEYAELIHESGRHLTELINDVLDLSKIEADRYELRREVFDARDAVNAAMRLMRVGAEEQGVALRALLPTAPVTVDADERAIKQMVLNLVSNALKFTPRGGGVDVSLREAAGALEIAVADTGLGIAPGDLARLGKPYVQAQAGRDAPQGTGLGLSLVKAFAALHGGDLLLESRLGEGTAATVRLPVLMRAGSEEGAGAGAR